MKSLIAHFRIMTFVILSIGILCIVITRLLSESYTKNISENNCNITPSAKCPGKGEFLSGPKMENDYPTSKTTQRSYSNIWEIYKIIDVDGEGVLDGVLRDDFNKYAFLSRDGKMRILDIDRECVAELLDKGRAKIRSFDVSRNWLYAVSGNDEGKIVLWDLSKMDIAKEANNDGVPVNDLKINAQGNKILTGDSAGGVAIWEIPSLKKEKKFTSHNYEVRKVLFVPNDESMAITVSKDGVRLWNIVSVAEIRKYFIDENNPILLSVKVCNEGKKLFCGTNCQLHVIDIDSGLEINKMEKDYSPYLKDNRNIMACHYLGVYSISIFPSNNQIITCGFDGYARVWDIKSGGEVWESALNKDERREIHSSAISSDGANIILGAVRKIKECGLSKGEIIIFKKTKSVGKAVYENRGHIKH